MQKIICTAKWKEKKNGFAAVAATAIEAKTFSN